MSKRRSIIKLYIQQSISMSTIADLLNIKEAEVARVISAYSRLKNNNNVWLIIKITFDSDNESFEELENKNNLI